jgi:hypothetical protein
MRVHANEIKTIFGSVAYEKAAEKAEYTHWIMDKAEYAKLVKYKTDYEDAIEQLEEEQGEKTKLQEKYNSLVEKYNGLVEDFNKIYTATEETAEKVKEIEKIKAETEAVRQTKQNIIELIRERANKERKIKDKKNDPGYVVKSSYHIEYRCGKSSTTMMWKTTIQTPFFTELDKSQFWDYFKNDEYRIEYFRQIGIGDFYGDINLNSKSDIEAHKGKYFIDYCENKNFSTGFWEITLIHYEEVVL